MNKKEQDKILKKIFIVLVVILVGFAGVIGIMNYLNYFEYREVDFEMDKNEIKGVTLYRTVIPVLYNNQSADYNFYLREDPRKLDEAISMKDEIIFRKNMVLEVKTDNLFCGGDWNYFKLQMANIEIFNINVMVKNNSLKYLPADDFMFIIINEGEKTEIKQIQENAYEFNINNCEIAAMADKFLLETIVKYNEIYNKK